MSTARICLKINVLDGHDMKILLKKSSVYNDGLDISTLKEDFHISFSFSERLAILFGSNIQFNSTYMQKGIVTIADGGDVIEKELDRLI